ncbi:PDE2 phosphodiesterase, partial [Pitta sordida]|nr:PDE2 phosphodiesterase [Pitta sordida]
GLFTLAQCKRSPQHFKPYLTPDLPKRFHYANNIRIDKVHLLVDRQWLAVRDESYTFCDGGNHGYNNEFKSMEAIFLGYGPSFKEKTEVDAFENIEVYNLMCDLLRITPAPNNGTHGSLNHLLKKPFYSPSHPKEDLSPSSCPVSSLVPEDTLGCICTYMDAKTLNERLNLTTEEIKEASSYNLPFGRPKVLQKKNEYCLLSHHQYVSGYSYDIWMPLWTAYTVNKPESTSPLPPTISDCLRADVRIPAARSQNCSNYPEGLTFSHNFLYPPNFNSSALEQYDALLTSNIVPMYRAFTVKKLCSYMCTPAHKHRYRPVISFPALCLDFLPLWQKYKNIWYVNNTKIPVPTHYFVVLTSCKNKSYTPLNCLGSLDVLSFIIPHRPDNSESCAENKTLSEWVEERVQAHSARVRDVELLTGLDFYQGRNESVSDILQLKTFLPIFETEN